MEHLFPEFCNTQSNIPTCVSTVQALVRGILMFVMKVHTQESLRNWLQETDQKQVFKQSSCRGVKEKRKLQKQLLYILTAGKDIEEL